ASLGGLAAALALALAAPGGAVEKPTAEPRKAAGLTGRFLVASPQMNDPRFAHTVIYMLRHDATGALGLVVNRPSTEVPIAELLGRLGLAHEGVRGSMRLHYGGPVEPGRVFVLHTADYRVEGTQVIADGIALSGPEAVLRAIGAGAGPRRALLVLSYSGWGPGQLERELQAGAWVSVPADAALLFDDQDDTKWQRALGRRTIDL
ncbi:MAG TPA: YqgE/AlgH family protein, partial [Anaeromyxobacteraceae bacterium]|nr:YqgE/AlgH family protein [Anaeromyxobacteraceae bacterium]